HVGGLATVSRDHSGAVARSARFRRIATSRENRLKKPTVLVVGGGFAGLNAVRRLARRSLDVVLLDITNYHLFQPLLYQVATAAPSPGDIAAPLRTLLHKHRNSLGAGGHCRWCCPRCSSGSVTKDGTTKLGGQRFSCSRCSRRFTLRSSSAFSGRAFADEIIVLAVRWYVRYRLSYAEVSEWLAERGILVDQSTVYRWVR